MSREIQLAIAPVFLLSAVGSILGVLANRLARVVDRSRLLEDVVRAAPHGAEGAREELACLSRRMQLIYSAIALAVLSSLFVGVLIVVAFADAFLVANLAKAIGALFVSAMLALIGSLLAFLREIFLAVTAARRAMR